MRKCRDLFFVIVLQEAKNTYLSILTPRIIGLFKQLLLSDFQNEQWAWLPAVICHGYYSELNRVMVDPSYLLKHTYYEELTPPSPYQWMVTRAQNYKDQKCVSL